MSDEKKGVSESLRDWGIDVDRFGERAKASLADARGDLTEIRGTLRQTLIQAKEVVMALQSAGSPAAAELKVGFDKAWQEIERAFKAAREQARAETETASAESMPAADADSESGAAKPPGDDDHTA